MPTMPSGLTPTVWGYSFSGPGGVMSTPVAGGAARYGMAYDRGTQSFNVTMVLDAAEFSVWVLFYLRIINQGAIAFDMTLDSGLGPAVHEVNIVPGTYSSARTGGIATIVSFTVAAISGVYALSDGEVAAYGLSATEMPTGFVPTVANYSIEGPEGVVQEDGGFAAYARQHDRGPQRFTCSLTFTPARFAIWSVWYHRKIDKGTRAFEMQLDSGLGVEPHVVNIVPETYSAMRSGGSNTVVTFTVEGEPTAYAYSAAEAQAIIDLFEEYGVDTSGLLARLAYFTLVDMLVLDF